MESEKIKNIELFSEIYQLIICGTENILSNRRLISIRRASFASKKIIKVAFDTRRIDQESDINPRRGLQNYNRSEAFLTEAMADKLKSFSKLKNVLGELKIKYGKEPEWQDSNARILLSTIDKSLRVNYSDGDYTDSQPGVGNINYIEELLHVRYRLGFDEINKLASDDLKKIILSKDEELIRKIGSDIEITKEDVGKQSYDMLIEKLFGGVKATKENKDVERSITITIRDRFVEEKLEEKA